MSSTRLLNALIGGLPHCSYPGLKHLRETAQGSIVWVPGERGVVGMWMRASGFIIDPRKDALIEYQRRYGGVLRMHRHESVSLSVATSGAAIVIATGALA